MSSDEKRPLGKILLQRKLISQQDLDDSLQAQRQSQTPAPIASQLVGEGKVDEIDALRALSEQYGVPGIDLTEIAISLEHLDVVPPAKWPRPGAFFPVLMRGDDIFLAMADPHDKRVVDELEFVTGKKVYPYIAVHSTLLHTIVAAYDAKARGDQHYLGPRVPRIRSTAGLPAVAHPPIAGSPRRRQGPPSLRGPSLRPSLVEPSSRHRKRAR